MGLAQHIKICKMLTDLHPERAAGGCCGFSCRSIASLSSPSLTPNRKETLGGLFERQAVVFSGPDHMGTSGCPAVPDGDIAVEWLTCVHLRDGHPTAPAATIPEARSVSLGGVLDGFSGPVVPVAIWVCFLLLAWKTGIVPCSCPCTCVLYIKC